VPILLNDNREVVAAQIHKFANDRLLARKHPPTGNVCYLLRRTSPIHEFELKQLNRDGYLRECPRQGATEKINSALRRMNSPWIVWVNDRALTHGYGRFYVKTPLAHAVEEYRRGIRRDNNLRSQIEREIHTLLSLPGNYDKIRMLIDRMQIIDQQSVFRIEAVQREDLLALR
jgi:hypothetical protein